MTFARKHLVPLFLLAVGVTLIYSNSLTGSFLLDDYQVEDRPNLHLTEINFAALKGTFYWAPNSKKIYRPLPCLTLGINYYFGRDNPFGYHVVNVTIHILCAISVYIFLKTLLSIPGIRPHFATKHSYEIAVIATFLFAFHPIQTNVATYIIQRMTSMAAWFYIVSVTGYISFRMQTLPNTEKRTFRKVFSLSACIISGICSMLSKENAAMLPVILLLTDYLFFYNLTDEDKKKTLRRAYAISFFLLLVLAAYFGTKPLLSYLNGYSHRDFSLIERMLTEPRIVFFYLYLILLPNVGLLNLNHDFTISRSIIDPLQSLFSVLGIVFLVVTACLVRKKYNLLSFVIVWYLGNLLIESTIIPLELIFEHRTYLPGVLIFFLMSFGIVYVSKRLFKNNRVILATSLLLILYGNGTYLRNVIFTTPISLWQDVVQKSPNLPRAHANLGKAYMDAGYYMESKAAYEEALKLKPDMIEPLVNLSKLYMNNLGMEEQALTLAKRALRLGPKSFYIPMVLGDAYYKMGDHKMAEHFYDLTVKRVPFYLPAINALGIVKINLGKKEEAKEVFEYGIKIDPGHEDLNTNLAKLYSNEKHFSDAIRTLDNFLVKNENSKKGKVLLRLIRQKAASAKAVEE